MKIFIADDSPLMRERLIELLLEINKIKIVGEADNSVDAFEKVKKLKPDIAILDIKMPGYTGIELLRYIREINKRIKIIILTNYPYPQFEEKSREYGADYFLSKNEDIEDVYDIVSDLVSNEQNDIYQNDKE